MPRIDRDILRLAYVDITLETPIAVACDEAVNLATNIVICKEENL